MISCIIPSYREGEYLHRCIDYIYNSISEYKEDVEVIVVINDPSIGRVNAKNIGAEKARGDILTFIDADCIVSKNFFQEVSDKSKNHFFIGGGVKYTKLDKYSIGRLGFYIFLGFYLLFKQITVGAFWVRREVFEYIGGFRETEFDDIDFALRLKQYASNHKKKFESLKRSYLVWSTRKFDEYGDWHWLKGYKTERLISPQITMSMMNQ